MTRRLAQLLIGLWLFGISLAMVIRSGLGNASWDVLHQGLANHLPITIGQAVILMSLLVLLVWIPLREIPGVGTLLNAVVVGYSIDVSLGWLSTPRDLWLRVVLLLVGIVLNGLATGLYIGARLGSGPRDGLMTGLHRRTALPIGLVRWGLEITVVVLGWLLGGVVGVGTLVFAFAIGPLVQVFLPICTVPGDEGVKAAS
ncbi:MAG TPA: hypothetical protein P5108_04550 [Marmoricola sp.]|nr:hypothetical protein [Marmoricola sp.]HMY09159.1 hypothetical protein [Marmoricola sp.]HRV68702.1 hypothetical protein [Marmoricola sp.]